MSAAIRRIGMDKAATRRAPLLAKARGRRSRTLRPRRRIESTCCGSTGAPTPHDAADLVWLQHSKAMKCVTHTYTYTYTYTCVAHVWLCNDLHTPPYVMQGLFQSALIHFMSRCVNHGENA